ncbi:hypothetical protein B0H13DRAFT_1869317 [Mycena leptocephala]|nr:hypothetical protein B0H13DRAFT_1869317 [Mycena leptocephala]
MHYLQNTKLLALDNYQFVRGKDSFSFTNVAAADKVLETVETNLWTPNPYPTYEFAKVVSMKLPATIEQSTALPFKKGEGKAFTETQRALADKAEVATSEDDLKAKLAKTEPGRYTELDPDILGGMQVLTLITMPPELVQWFKIALQQLDAIIPGEYKWEDSRREHYAYHVSGHGALNGVHPNKLHKPQVKVNFSQRIPYCMVETIQKSMEFEALSEVFSEVLEFHNLALQFEHLCPETYNKMRMFADVLPLNTSSPAYPFGGFMFNLRVATDAHKDTKDNDECEIIFANREGGQWAKDGGGWGSG